MYRWNFKSRINTHVQNFRTIPLIWLLCRGDSSLNLALMNLAQTLLKGVWGYLGQKLSRSQAFKPLHIKLDSEAALTHKYIYSWLTCKKSNWFQLQQLYHHFKWHKILHNQIIMIFHPQEIHWYQFLHSCFCTIQEQLEQEQDHKNFLT